MRVAGSVEELRLLADPTRARIVSLILASDDGRALVGVLAEQLGLRQPTVSHHVKALVDGGVLSRRPDGRTVWYSIDPAGAERVAEVLRPAADAEVGEAVLDRIATDLGTRFAGTFSRETVERYVRESHALLARGAEASRHLASRTSRFAADRLSALEAAESPAAALVPQVLFVCVQNAGRSQLAAGILRQLAGDRVGVRTAGSSPAGELRSVIVSVLDEIGVPVAGEYPKPLTDEVVRAADVVVTMGCGDACPVYPGRRYLDWQLDDPAELPIARVREIRDDIEVRVRELLVSLRVNGG
jgi:arsenate reductase